MKIDFDFDSEIRRLDESYNERGRPYDEAAEAWRNAYFEKVKMCDLLVETVKRGRRHFRPWNERDFENLYQESYMLMQYMSRGKCAPEKANGLMDIAYRCICNGTLGSKNNDYKRAINRHVDAGYPMAKSLLEPGMNILTDIRLQERPVDLKNLGDLLKERWQVLVDKEQLRQEELENLCDKGGAVNMLLKNEAGFRELSPLVDAFYLLKHRMRGDDIDEMAEARVAYHNFIGSLCDYAGEPVSGDASRRQFLGCAGEKTLWEEIAEEAVGAFYIWEQIGVMTLEDLKEVKESAKAFGEETGRKNQGIKHAQGYVVS